MVDCMLLAPVPWGHLKSAYDMTQENGPETRVAFGTEAWEALMRLDVERDGVPVPTILYPSSSGNEDMVLPSYLFEAKYIGSAPRSRTYPPACIRPPAVTHDEGWSYFWEVVQIMPSSWTWPALREVLKYDIGAVPRGPTRIAHVGSKV